MIFFELTTAFVLIQFRNRHILLATILFSVFLVFLFTLSFPEILQGHPSFYSGVFWISSFFSGTLILTNQNQLQTNKVQQGLLLTGIDAIYLFFSKMASSLIYMLLIQVILLIVMNMFFIIPLNISLANLLLYVLLGSIGYISVGTFLFSMMESQNIRDLMITILFYPLIVPLFLFVHKATSMVFDGKTPNVLGFIVGYNLIFVFLSALLYEFVVEDNT